VRLGGDGAVRGDHATVEVFNDRTARVHPGE
jgi:hypothetical protein